MDVVAVDIGGTHARFALAKVTSGTVIQLGEAFTVKAAEHPSLEHAWQAFEAQLGQPLPRAAAIAIACPVKSDVLKLTNSPWQMRQSELPSQLAVDQLTIVNDFEAVGHAVAQAEAHHFLDLCGPDVPLPAFGTISIIGPGTGLGVAHVWRVDGGYRVQATEGGHLDFAPLDSFEDELVSRLRQRHRRVSTERVVSGPGLADIYLTLAHQAGASVRALADDALWALGMGGTDPFASAAIERFCLSLGSVAGDIALAQGGSGVVIAGGLGYRIKDILLRSGFATRFCSKGRFEAMMAELPVKLITHPQPGLFGAAAAFGVQSA